MDISTSSQGPFTLARLSGEFTLGEETKIADELHPLVADRGSRLAIDLSELTQINSLGLSELINVVIRARLSHSRVVLVSPTNFVRGVFGATHLDRWFEIVDSVDEAVGALHA